MATWKKVITAGSQAELAKLTIATNSGTQVIGTQAETNLSGSFSGSFYGDGSKLNNVTATAIFPTTNMATPIVDGDKFFTSGSEGEGNSYVSGTQVSDYVFSKITAGPVRVSAGGTSTVQNSSITNQMLQNSTISNVALGSSLANLSLGNGFTTTTTYNGSAAVTATIGAGNLIAVDANAVRVKANANVTNNDILRYSSANGGELDESLLSQNNANTQVVLSADATLGFKTLAGGIDVTGDSVFQNDLYVKGNFTASGTASFINVQNLSVSDKFILLNSGSGAAPADAGIIAAKDGFGSGSAFYLESINTSPSYGRWAVAYGVTLASSNGGLTADEYVVTTKATNVAPTGFPTWGGETQGYGNMWVNTANSDIYIYA